VRGRSNHQSEDDREHECASDPELAAEHRSDDDNRDRDDHVGEAHQDRVGPTAVVPGDRADGGSDRGGDEPDNDHDRQRLLRAAHDDRENIAPNLILAKGMIADRERPQAEGRLTGSSRY